MGFGFRPRWVLAADASLNKDGRILNGDLRCFQ